MLEETVSDADGNLIRNVVYTMGHDHISQTTFGPGEPVAGTTLVFHMDAHGSTRILTDLADSIANLAAQQIFHYTAYGNAINFSMSEAATQYLYSGEQFDSRVGQQYLRARYYNQANGTFSRLDPFFGNTTDPQSFHKYLYTHGDPVNGIDPTGRNLLSTLGVMSARVAFQVSSFAIGHYSVIQTVTTVAMGVSLVSMIWIVLEDAKFVPETQVNDWAFLLSSLVWTAGLSLTAIADQTRGAVGPLKGSKRGVINNGKKQNRRYRAEPGNENHEDPYDDNSVAASGQISKDAKLVRVYRDDPANPQTNTSAPGKWVMPKKDIEGLSPSQIQDKYALPQTPTHVVDAAGLNASTGYVKQNFGGHGGAVQIELHEHAQFSGNRPIPQGGIK